MSSQYMEIPCMIPNKPVKVVGIQEYQTALAKAKNKGQKLRVCLRVLSSMGYHANIDPDLHKTISEFLEDYHEELYGNEEKKDQADTA